MPGDTIRRFWTRLAHYHGQTWNGAELDLLVVRDGARVGFEVKRTSVPRVTRSMRTALEVLGLDRIDVVSAGTDVFPLAEQIRAVGIEALPAALG